MFWSHTKIENAEQPGIINKIRLTAILLVVFILANGGYAFFKGRQATDEMINTTLKERLTISQSVLRYELRELDIIGGIVQEQEQKFINYLDLDKIRPIQVMLQTIATKNQLDKVFFLDEDKKLLVTNRQSESEITNPNSYHALVDSLPSHAELTTIPTDFFRDIIPAQEGMLQAPARLSCMKSIIPMYHDLGDIYGYVVLVEFIDNNQSLAKRLTESIDSPFVFYNIENQAILSNFFSNSVPYPTSASIIFAGKTYYSQSTILVDSAGHPATELAVMVDKELFSWQQRHQTLNNMLPLAALICLTLFLNFMMDQLKKSYTKIELARQEAESANVAKSEFLANMSHEIRTPLNAVVGLTGLALKTDLSIKQHDYLTKIHSSSNVLLDIINDILDFSKIEAGKLELEQANFDFNEILCSLKNIATVKAEEKDIELILQIASDMPCAMVGDSMRLFQILLNLTTNAIKFTETGHVLIKTEVLKENDLSDQQIMIKFSIEDTGIGLEPQQISKLFHSFTQADSSTTRKFGGTGLGLTICTHLVEAMDGKITVESTPGKGSIFSFTALFGVQEDPKPSQFTCPTSYSAIKILVVDDNQVARDIIHDALKQYAFTVQQASSGEQAIDMLLKSAEEKDPYHLVLMDWKMEGMNGIETAKKIKGNTDLTETPAILMITAHGYKEVQTAAEEAGLDGFLVKPINNSQLISTIMKVLGTAIQPTTFVPVDPHSQITGLDKISGAHILLVEDNEINQQVASELLESVGFKVTITDNGQEGVDALLHRPTPVPYDAVLMDIQMPKMDGYSATKAIRKADSPLNTIPIIAMTAHAMDSERRRCREVGMNDHLAKPISPNKLYTTLVKWISAADRSDAPPVVIPPSPTPPQAAQPDVSIDLVCFPAELTGFDINTGLERFAGNKELYLKLLFKLLEKYESIDETIGLHLKNQEFDKARDLTHMMKGATGNFGAHRLHTAATKLEQALKNNETQEAFALFANFSKALQEAMSAITALQEAQVDTRKEDTVLLPATINQEKITTLLDDLQHLISTDYSAALDQAINLMTLLKGTPLVNKTETLQTLLENFAEAEALACVEEIRLDLLQL